MTRKTELVDAIRNARFQPSTERPRLLFGAEDLRGLRERAAARPGVLETARDGAARAMAQPAGAANAREPYLSGTDLVAVASAYALSGDAAYGPWLRERMDAMLALKTWFHPVHVNVCRVCDHVVCNTAAQVALAHDLAFPVFGEGDGDRIAAGLRRLHLEPFLDGTQGQAEWWFGPAANNNWKIMCCGETGLAVCGYVERWPEAPEALARAAQGVWELLDLVPAEGDWGEGPSYWFTTLWMGLRYARALRRLTGGAADLFQHPSLRVTGDFLAQLTAPSGRIYNCQDCDPEMKPVLAESLAILAAAQKRPDWMYVARLAPAPTPLFLACDDPAVESRPSDHRAAAFPASGVATLRTGWGADDVFVGFRAGPSDVGHSHLDANSFVLEAGGQRLTLEHPYWPQGHFLGFFDPSGPRWNFDGPATVGHSTLLVDGQGQTWGKDFAARLLGVRDEGRCLTLAGEAGRAYPGLLRRFTRTILLLPPDTLVIRDIVECEGDRHVEWLLHYDGEIRSEGVASIVTSGSVSLSVVPFLPDLTNGWRWSDVTRTSLYQHSNNLRMVTPSIRYRSFSAFRKAPTFEFLFGLRVHGTGEADFRFETADGGWRLRPAGSGCAIEPTGDGMQVIGNGESRP